MAAVGKLPGDDIFGSVGVFSHDWDWASNTPKSIGKVPVLNIPLATEKHG